jgi:hypothetical protein
MQNEKLKRQKCKKVLPPDIFHFAFLILHFVGVAERVGI